eukprot:1755597-Prymnesium_polylepis.1
MVGARSQYDELSRKVIRITDERDQLASKVVAANEAATEATARARRVVEGDLQVLNNHVRQLKEQLIEQNAQLSERWKAPRRHGCGPFTGPNSGTVLAHRFTYGAGRCRDRGRCCDRARAAHPGGRRRVGRFPFRQRCGCTRRLDQQCAGDSHKTSNSTCLHDGSSSAAHGLTPLHRLVLHGTRPTWLMTEYTTSLSCRYVHRVCSSRARERRVRRAKAMSWPRRRRKGLVQRASEVVVELWVNHEAEVQRSCGSGSLGLVLRALVGSCVCVCHAPNLGVRGVAPLVD